MVMVFIYCKKCRARMHPAQEYSSMNPVVGVRCSECSTEYVYDYDTENLTRVTPPWVTIAGFAAITVFAVVLAQWVTPYIQQWMGRPQ